MTDKDILEELDRPAHPALAYWRERSPQKAAEVEGELVTYLVGEFAGRVNESLLIRVGRGDPFAPVFALWSLLETRPLRVDFDIRGTWLLLAALREKVPVPSRLLANLLADRAAGLNPEHQLEKLELALSLARRWRRKWRKDECSHDGFTTTLGAYQRFERRYADHIGAEDAVVKGRFGAATVGGILPNIPTLRVVDAIGDPDSREGRDVVRLYGSLVEPLPLRGTNVSPETVAAVLEREFPWMTPAIEFIRLHMQLRRATGVPWFHIPPLLLVGPPGVGKTRFAQRAASLVGTGYAEMSAAGSGDNRMLQGTARGWSSTQPALPLIVMRQSGAANPFIVVDEIDKVARSSHNGNIQATLLTLLENESAKNWYDECLLGRADLSQVSWILTANELTPLPDPLRSRLAVVQVGLPRPGDFDALLFGIRMDIAKELQVSLEDLPPLEPEAVENLRRHFLRGMDARRLKAAVHRALASGNLKGPPRN